MKVYIEGNDPALSRMFLEEGWKEASSPIGVDLICLEGGADVSPELYGEENTSSSTSPEKDVESFGLISLARVQGIPLVGICRGAQALCVAHGGKLRQHISGHGYWHRVMVYGGPVEVSSSHHQECVPLDEAVSKVFYAEDGTTEIVLWGNGDMSFQPHPEYHEEGHEGRVLFFDLLKAHVGVSA